MNVVNTLHHLDQKIRKYFINFSETLSKLGFDHNLVDQTELSKKLGLVSIILDYTKGGILLHPGKLVRAMIDTLPTNVQSI